MKQSILLLFCVLYSLTSFAQSSESNRIFTRGVELYNLHEYKAAISEFKKCQELDDVEMDSLDFRKEYTKEWIAHCYYKLSDIENAKAVGVQDFDIVPIDRTKTVASDSIISLANLIFSNGNISFAITKVKEALDLEDKMLGSNNYTVANTHAMLVSMYTGTNNTEQAEQELTLAKRIYQDQGYENSYAYGKLLLREAYLNLKKENRAEYLRLSEEALAIFNKWNNANYKELIDTYYLLALGNNTPLPNEQAEKYLYLLFDQLKHIQGAKVYDYAEQINFCSQGLLYFHHNIDALEILDVSLNYVRSHSLLNGNDQFYISLLATRANILLSLNKYDEALDDALSIISACENTMFFDKNLLDEFYLLLANIYYYKKEPQLELEAAKEAYNRASARKDDRSLVKANAKSFMAGAHNFLEKKKEALADLEETISIYEKMGLINSSHYAAALSLKAGIEAISNPLQAIDDYRKCVALFSKQNPPPYDGLLNAKLSLFDLLKNQLFEHEADSILEEIEQMSLDSNIPVFFRDKIKISLYSTKGDLYSMVEPSKSINYYKQAKEIAQKFDGFDTSSFDMNLALSYLRNSDIKRAIAIIDSLLAQLKVKTEKSLQYAHALKTASYIYASKGDVLQMRNYQTQSLKLMGEIYGKGSLNYASTLNSIALELAQLGFLVEARPLCNEAEKIALSYLPNYDPRLSDIYTCKQFVELYIGNVDKAIEYGERAKTFSEKYMPPLALCERLCNLSNCYLKKYQFNKALSLLNEAMDIAEKENGRMNMRCANIFLQLNQVYQAMGNYSEANACKSCYYEIFKELADTTQLEYGVALLYNANQKLQEDNVEDAKRIANVALSVFENSLGNKNPVTLQVKAAIVKLTIQEGNLTEAIKELELILEAQNKNKYSDLEIMNLLATIYGMNGNFKQQKEISEKMIDISRQKYGDESQQVGDAYLILSNAYFRLGKTRKSADCSIKAFNICRKTVLNNFLFMTKKERADLWDNVSNFFLNSLPTACAFSENHVDYSPVTYNAALLSKGLLLQAETNISDLIYSKGSESIKNDYNQFIYTKNLYNKATASFSTDVELDELFMHKAIIDSLENEINFLEHDLMKHINSEFGDYTTNLSTTWSDVSKSLGQSDIAIEFLNDTWSPDSIDYFALVLDSEAKAPLYVKLFSNAEIRKYHDFKSLTVEQMKEFSVLLWQPILSLFPNTKNIFFSPCGDLYNIPIESLPTFINDSFLSDNYNFYRLSSTRELTAKYNHWKKNNISLYGDVKYDASIEELSTNEQKYKDNTVRSVEFENEGKDRGLITLNPLPGTANEVSSIASLVTSSQSLSMESPPFVGLEASEASVKSLSNRGDRVLHIATHGFYFPETKISNSKYLQSIFSIEYKGGVVTYDSPEDAALLRCGLYMAGAKSSLQGKKPTGVDDGILTAREISMINLKGLDLAILSACETGIGDISGDGVFGLQRGFKKAGTHSILMSLWKVDDNATSYLMKEFYSSWLSGSTKQAALEYAKKQVRSRPEWISPKYWSAFVLLDGIEN